MGKLTQQILNDSEELPSTLQREVLDFIGYLKQKRDTKKIIEEPNGIKLAQLMKEIAQRGTAFAQIKDPVKWQQETGKDRPLPGRER